MKIEEYITVEGYKLKKRFGLLLFRNKKLKMIYLSMQRRYIKFCSLKEVTLTNLGFVEYAKESYTTCGNL